MQRIGSNIKATARLVEPHKDKDYNWLLYWNKILMKAHLYLALPFADWVTNICFALFFFNLDTKFGH